MEKVCNNCKLLKDSSYFYKDNSLKTGLTKECKECKLKRLREERKNPIIAQKRRDSSRAWRQGNPTRYKYMIRNSTLKKKYGLTIDDYNSILDKQNGLCAICLSDKPQRNWGNSPLLVDHCHETKRVRGLICHKCNWGLGAFNDDIKLLKTAIYYLEANKNE